MEGFIYIAISIGVFILISFLSGLTESKRKIFRFIGYFAQAPIALLLIGGLIFYVCQLFVNVFINIPHIIIKVSVIAIIYFCAKYYVINKFGIHAWKNIWRTHYLDEVENTVTKEEYLEMEKQIKKYGKVQHYVLILSLVCFWGLNWVGYQIAESVMTDEALHFFEMGKYSKEDEYDDYDYY